jgi:predicted Zn-dependent peptidase
LENTETQMNWMGEHLLGYGTLPEPETVRRRLAAVTPGEIRATAREFFQPDRLSLALIGPGKSASALQALLRASFKG